MNKNTENLLIATYQNTSTAIQSIENCIEDIACKELKNEISEELRNYTNLNDDIEKIADDLEIELKDNNAFEKVRLWSSIKVSTLIDKSCRHYAEMFFLGSNMGVFDCICAICDNPEADKKVVELANRLLHLEENYACEMKKYFCNKNEK